MSVFIQEYTTLNPITLMGHEAGVCYGSENNSEKDFKRGLNCIDSGHGRVMEYPQIYMVIEEKSARVIREYTRHIGGLSTYLQASTRYINYENFNYIVPPSIKNDSEANKIYVETMETIREAQKKLYELNVPKEDIGMILPLGMETKIVWRGNLRSLIDMSHVRMCKRAYWEYRELFREILIALSNYSSEWKILIEEKKIFKPICEVYGYCPEVNSCGKKASK